MIGRLRGVIADRLPDGSSIVDVNGVGYEVFVPLGTLGRLPASPEEVTLHVHTHVREDQLVLFGFARTEDRSAFRALLGISNVGPKLALAILGAMDARQLASAIASQDRTRFKGIPGVGKRTVERLLLELKDKLGFVAATVVMQSRSNGRAASPADAAPLAQVTALLVNMGFKPAEAELAVASVAGESEEEQSVETLLRKALGQLG
mgnify:CR=1 FL=1